jgi:hypothetical protein
MNVEEEKPKNHVRGKQGARPQDALVVRMRELEGEGMEEGQAFHTAMLEYRINRFTGDHLEIFIYGDFDPPNAALEFWRLR